MSHNPPLVPGVVYHIYNRGNNGESIFIEERNYHYFMKLYAKYIAPVAETYAYCLLGNHFHLMVRILDENDCQSSPTTPLYRDDSAQDCQSFEDWQSLIWRAFSNLFSTYTKAINKAYQRSGSLFEKPFKRKPVTDDGYFKMLVAYIHQNPQKHGLIDDFREWPFSSYQAMIGNKPTLLAREVTHSWFDGNRGLVQYHETTADFRGLVNFIDDE